jgi:hypothetical protein
MGKSNIARTFKKGEIYYVSGGNTKVEIIRPQISKGMNGHKSEVRILECSEHSQFEKKLGKLRIFNNKNLYPENKIGSKIAKILKWKGN